jgi:SAM-dependent methyltransferase
MWDERYATTDYVYGTEPNEFLRQVIAARGLAAFAGDGRMPRALCLAEGEGRNAVHLAGLGFAVTAVDASATGLAKAERLASECGVRITTVVCDLADFPIAADDWDLIVSIYAHLRPELRAWVHGAVVAGLRPGGWFVLEGYAPAQLGRGTGGPTQAALLVPLESLRRELDGLQLEHALECEREVIEGRLHTGLAAVVQIVARKPPA